MNLTEIFNAETAHVTDLLGFSDCSNTFLFDMLKIGLLCIGIPCNLAFVILLHRFNIKSQSFIHGLIALAIVNSLALICTGIYTIDSLIIQVDILLFFFISSIIKN